jgi:hypothetical protein
MKNLMICFLVSGSISAFAQDIKPLVITSDNISVAGCFGITKSNNMKRETVVFRIFKGLNSIVINENKIGEIIVLEGEKATNSQGLSASYMPFESESSLPDYYNENWTYPAPATTILSARGNYKGFFVNDNAEGLLVRHKFYQINDLNLKCTADETLLMKKINSVLNFSPM